MNLLTEKEHRQHAKERAAEAFSDHQITTIVDTERVKVFRCQRPGTWIYGFYLTFTPGAILVNGDIGPLLIDRPSGGLNWLHGNGQIINEDYLFSKSSMANEDDFMPGDAQAWLDDEATDQYGSEAVDEIRAEWDQSDDGVAWDNVVYEATTCDTEFPRFRAHSFNSLFCYEALKWFCAAYHAQQQTKADEVPA